MKNEAGFVFVHRRGLYECINESQGIIVALAFFRKA